MEDAANDAAIQERRVEIRASLRNVENSLRDAGAVTDGYASAYFLESNSEDESSSSTSLFRRKAERVSAAILARSAALRFDFDPPDQIRHSWKLTPLGEAKCRRIWSLFDEDQDDAWAYEEFQEYLAALTSSKTSTETRAFTDSEEVWRMYMSDVCELDDDMRLTFEGFKLYRERIEDEQPLARDLALLGVSLQWEELEKSKTVKELFQEYMDDLKGGLTAKSAQYFLAELGFVLTCRETLQIIERRNQHCGS
ncbi:hypothetical protein PHYBOEH_005167 [Phytophthora boehmeriae]|uniref:Uncharacterized protein n=1 Tax=Phytophthora boehmeriae TaxID=109152 RepID=A0A8T1WKM9_9STRA|nr:hypothetical protein PHYBOEH_005167 [Phytophthora boehmeriae]